MGIFDFGCKFHDLNHFELFFSIPWIHYTLEVNIKYFFIENHQFNVILSWFNQFFDNYLFNITTCTPAFIVF
jgi:hypothetical protein